MTKRLLLLLLVFGAGVYVGYILFGGGVHITQYYTPGMFIHY